MSVRTRTLRAFSAIFLPFIGVANGTVTTTNPPPMHILMLRAGVDADAVVQEFNLKPKFIYRHALNGFAAPMDSNTVERLKHDNRVRAVGDNGDVRLACSIFTAFLVPASSIATQQVPAGIL